jgi:hypothetical protein
MAGAPKGNNNNPKGNPATLIPGGAQKVAMANNGRFSEQTRERLRGILGASVKAIEDMLDGNATLTPTELINVFRVVSPYVLTELKPVIDKTLCLILAEVLAEDARIPSDAIPEITDRILARLNEE